MALYLLEEGAKAQDNSDFRWKFSAVHSARSAEMVQLLLEFNERRP
jgi:hypothetical protein